jgi:hypothetical protein
VSLKKYVPRSIQNIFNRLEAFNESLTEKLFSEQLPETFEVVVYCSKNPETTTPTSEDPADLSPDVANYNFFKARSLAGHHDLLVAPENARFVDEYERLRNLHFQAILKKSSGITLPQTGDVWLATQVGGNMVSLISFERSGDPNKFKIPEGDGPAQAAHTNGTSPTTTVGAATTPAGTAQASSYTPIPPSGNLPTSALPLPTLDATQRKLLDFISSGEGKYDASNNGTKKSGTQGPWFVNSIGTTSWVAYMNVTETKTNQDQKLLSTLTIGEIKAFQGWNTNEADSLKNHTFAPRPDATRTLFAVGRYQIIPSTMLHVLRDTGYDDSVVFAKEIQDQMGLTLIYGTKKKNLRKYLKGSSAVTLRAACLAIAQEWASFPDPNKYYDGYVDAAGIQQPAGDNVSFHGSGNKAKHTIPEVEKLLKEIRDYNISQGYTEQ